MLLNCRGMTLVVAALVGASTAATAQGTGFQVTYLGHATFQVQSPGGTVIMRGVAVFASEPIQNGAALSARRSAARAWVWATASLWRVTRP